MGIEPYTFSNLATHTEILNQTAKIFYSAYAVCFDIKCFTQVVRNEVAALLWFGSRNRTRESNFYVAALEK
jgi:hypothetical protein